MPIKAQDLVKKFCQEPQHIENMLYIKEGDTFCLYDEERGYYKMICDADFYEYVYKYLIENSDRSLSTPFAKDVTSQIKWMVYKKHPSFETNYLTVGYKLLNLETFEYEELDKMKYSFHQVPAATEDAGKPMFDKFLAQVLVDKKGKTDPELIIVMEEVMGYYLLSGMGGQSMFFFTGSGANGKSVLLKIIKEMVGKEFCSSMTIEKLTTDKFAVADLVGKKLNVCAEEESQYIKSDKFKALVAGDTIQAERKFGQSFSFSPSVKFLFATNNIPTFSGLDEALLRRVNIIPFHKRVAEEDQIPDLEKKIIENNELPAIIRMAINGAKRLVANKMKFSKSVQMEEMKQEFILNLSISLLYMKEHFIVSDENDPLAVFMDNNDIYAQFRIWCDRNGKKPVASTRFFKDILSLFGGKDSVLKWSPEAKKPVRGRYLREVEV